MKIREIIYEIDAADETPPIVWNKDTLKSSVHETDIEGHEILRIDSTTYIFYVIIDEQENLRSYVAVEQLQNEYYPLIRIQNLTNVGGLATSIIMALCGEGKKFIITKTEKLTKSGFAWLKKLLLVNGRGRLKITDQTGEYPDIRKLQSEWNDAYLGDEYGSTEIFIEAKSKKLTEWLSENTRQHKENHNLLKPYYIFYGDEKIL